MNILLVIETLMPGGAELFAVRLANSLSGSHAVTLAVLHGERTHPGVMQQVEPSVRVERLNLPNKRDLWKIDGLFRRLNLDRSLIRCLQRRWLQQIVRSVQPDIVHSHLLPADLLVAGVRQPGSFAHVITVHGDYLAYLTGDTRPLLLRAHSKIATLLERTEAIVTIAVEQRRALLARFPELLHKMPLITNGYSAPALATHRERRALNLPDGLLIGMVSRGVEKKGWASAVLAFEKAKIKDASLVLVGSGPFLDRLAAGGLPPNVIMTGLVDRPTDYIRHFDICILPTEFPQESLPTAIIEYLYCGKPVIATDVGEIGAMIANPEGERAGILVELDGTSDVVALAAAMRALAASPDERERLGRIAREAFAKFAMTTCAERYDDLYRCVVD